ncbi:Zinc finger HIT-type [Penicillium frequentans]|uniref:Box C/D snoRNA protein 1 n=1 Tax=Penicillium frequentans TaxID=3151616 RepID=A0AAD6CZH4_9EURO|nr:Zinc finger HIT-type [Penicillium glabrum]
MDSSDPLLSELCSICHVNPPKYRCPRCSTRTCSLPCTRRHKLWSQCSGVRDPAAYLKRSELATESAFDRDFNFITGVERSLERADREVENRGIDLGRGQAASGDGDEPGLKRKIPQQGLVKGEAAFLRRAEEGAVTVIRAPRGMSRNKLNNSRWHPKHKCLSWSVEWISAAGVKNLRNCLEGHTLADCYDRGFPASKGKTGESSKEEKKPDQQEGDAAAQDSTDIVPPATATEAENTTEPVGEQLGQPQISEAVESSTETAAERPQDLPIGPHRGLHFYLHRPRTTVKKPVLVPLAPSMTLAAALRERTVMEFPTIYVLPESPGTLLADKDTSSFMLEEEYIRIVGPEEAAEKSAQTEQDGAEVHTSGLPGSSVDLQNVDEDKVMEVLKHDLFEPET